MTENLYLGNDTDSFVLTSTDTDLPSGTTFTLNKSWTSADGTWQKQDVTVQRLLYSGNKAYGNYYNWYTLTAQTVSEDQFNIAATASLCPKGWKLPTHTIYRTLLTTNYGIDDNSLSDALRMTQFPLNFALAGRYQNEGNIYTGEYGEYWTSVAAPIQEDDIIRSRRMAFFTTDAARIADNTTVYFKTGTRARSVGNPARCIAK